MKDARGHGSNSRGMRAEKRSTGFQAKHQLLGAQARVKEYAARSAARQAELVAGGKSAMDAYHQTGEEFKNGPPGGYEHDRAAAAMLAQGHPKSAPVPTHSGTSGPANEYNRDLALRIRDRQVGSGMKRR